MYVEQLSEKEEKESTIERQLDYFEKDLQTKDRVKNVYEDENHYLTEPRLTLLQQDSPRHFPKQQHQLYCCSDWRSVDSSREKLDGRSMRFLDEHSSLRLLRF